MEIPAELRTRFEGALGQPITQIGIIRRGYSPAMRLRIWLKDGSTVFIKMATTDSTEAMLRQEYHVYATLSAPFLARLLAWESGDVRRGEYSFLVLEDLSEAYWPPPWSTQRIDQVLRVLSSLADYSVPGLEPLDVEEFFRDSWQTVAEDSQSFLSLGLATRRWLDRALPDLLFASQPEALRGDCLIHSDVRSDNLCFDGERAVLIDWNWACLSNPTLDLAAWLPSLEAEGGPPPEAFLPDAPAYAAIMSGYLASQAGLPVPALLPRLREVQRQQLHTALPWAIRALGLPPLDGPEAAV